jgi:hypothetical protein
MFSLPHSQPIKNATAVVTQKITAQINQAILSPFNQGQ